MSTVTVHVFAIRYFPAENVFDRLKVVVIAIPVLRLRDCYSCLATVFDARMATL